jgi:hypothetical protein
VARRGPTGMLLPPSPLMQPAIEWFTSDTNSNGLLYCLSAYKQHSQMCVRWAIHRLIDIFGSLNYSSLFYVHIHPR